MTPDSINSKFKGFIGRQDVAKIKKKRQNFPVDSKKTINVWLKRQNYLWQNRLELFYTRRKPFLNLWIPSMSLDRKHQRTPTAFHNFSIVFFFFSSCHLQNYLDCGFDFLFFFQKLSRRFKVLSLTNASDWGESEQQKLLKKKKLARWRLTKDAASKGPIRLIFLPL